MAAFCGTMERYSAKIWNSVISNGMTKHKAIQLLLQVCANIVQHLFAEQIKGLFCPAC